MSSADHRFGRVNFEYLFCFFLPLLPVENNKKYSIFKIQNSTRLNQLAVEDINVEILSKEQKAVEFLKNS